MDRRSSISEDASAWLEATTVDRAVFDLRPDYVALLIAADGLQPGPTDAVSERLLRDAEARAHAALAGRAPATLAEVADWRDAYRAFGAKPQRTRPSIEALLRRVDAGLPRVDRLTDAYNAVSVAHLLPVGGEDRARYEGPARLVRARGDEAFDTVRDGDPAMERPEPGEVVWRDDAGVTCRCWNWRQCRRTRITAATTSALFIFDGLGSLGSARLRAAGDELADSLTRLCPNVRLIDRAVGEV